MNTPQNNNHKFLSQNQNRENEHCTFCDRDNYQVDNCFRRMNMNAPITY